MASFKNAVLDALSAHEPDDIERRLDPFSFAYGDVLGEAGSPIEHVYFPESGLISVVVSLRGGSRVEAAMVGCNGVIGASVVFGGDVAINTGFAQIAGIGWRMRACDLVELAQRSRAIQWLLFRHEQFMSAQAQQTAACNAKHHIPERLCSWLMRAQDIAKQDELPLTQERLALILGVQRGSISMIAGTLQDAGLIHYRRGRVAIVDQQGLCEKACECYATLRSHHRRLFSAARPAGLEQEPSEGVIVASRPDSL